MDTHALVAIGSSHHTPTVAAASRIAVELIHAGFVVDLGNASMHAMPAPPDYDLVIIGATGRLGYDRDLLRWISDFSELLDDMPSGAFLLGGLRRCTRTMARFLRCGWQPLASTLLPDTPHEDDETVALIERFVVRLIALSEVAARQDADLLADSLPS
jgi:menaquinone-dependent protoporphyrinogen IX oxidase